MKMAKKLLAVVLAGVLALSVLTGCGDSVSTKTIVDALNDIGKSQNMTFKSDSTLNTKAKNIAEKLPAYLDSILGKAAQQDNEGGNAGSGSLKLTDEQKAAFMGIMGSTYNSKYVYLTGTETKGNNAVAQASYMIDQNNWLEVNAPADVEKGELSVQTADEENDTYYIGIATMSYGGKNYRIAVVVGDVGIADDAE